MLSDDPNGKQKQQQDKETGKPHDARFNEARSIHNTAKQRHAYWYIKHRSKQHQLHANEEKIRGGKKDPGAPPPRDRKMRGGLACVTENKMKVFTTCSASPRLFLLILASPLDPIFAVAVAPLPLFFSYFQRPKDDKAYGL